MSNHEVSRSSRRRGIAMSGLALAALLTLAGCKKSGDPAAGSGSAGASAQPVGAADDGRRAEDARLEAAIECLNRHSNRVFEARDAYVGSVDPQTGKLAGGSVPGRNEWFLEGTEPTEETRAVDPNDFLLHDQKGGP